MRARLPRLRRLHFPVLIPMLRFVFRLVFCFAISALVLSVTAYIVTLFVGACETLRLRPRREEGTDLGRTA